MVGQEGGRAGKNRTQRRAIMGKTAPFETALRWKMESAKLKKANKGKGGWCSGSGLCGKID